MSLVGFAAVTGEVTTGTALKTILQIVAPSNHRIRIDEVAISFKGTSNTAAPILVQVARQTNAGTMSSLTPVKWDSTDSETLQVSAQHTATAEPTLGDVLISDEIHPQTGEIWQAPLTRPIEVPGGTRLGILVTAGASTSVVARVIGEE